MATMTDFANNPQPVDAAQTSAADAQRARVEQLRRDRGGRTTAPARGHPAQNARIAATGLGVATMFGLIGVMGYAARSSATPQPAVVAQPPAQVTVVIHRNPAPSAATVVATGTPVDTVAVAAVAAPAAPIALTAQPVVRQAPAAQAPATQAPVVKTNGSR